MGKRKVNILDTAAAAVAEVAFFIESKGMPDTAKKFVDDAFIFFEKLADTKMIYRPCQYQRWIALGYRCATFRKKYTVAYLNMQNEIVVCDFVLAKLLAE
jgi:plasmid stabilization system protein ParE